jgi:VanZ family protein
LYYLGIDLLREVLTDDGWTLKDLTNTNLLFGVLVSIFDELFQGMIDGRSLSLFDILVDSTGYIFMFSISNKISELHYLYKNYYYKNI